MCSFGPVRVESKAGGYRVRVLASSILFGVYQFSIKNGMAGRYARKIQKGTELIITTMPFRFFPVYDRGIRKKLQKRYRASLLTSNSNPLILYPTHSNECRAAPRRTKLLYAQTTGIVRTHD
jgi:hypothetical protein